MFIAVVDNFDSWEDGRTKKPTNIMIQEKNFIGIGSFEPTKE
jgi:hypothetical protein